MILNDIADLFTDLCMKEIQKEVARHFGRKRKWCWWMLNCMSFKVDPEFIAGLAHYGYRLKLERITLDE